MMDMKMGIEMDFGKEESNKMTKCKACGYEKDYDLSGYDVSREEMINQEGEDFIKIRGCTFMIKKIGSYRNSKEIDLYACPKCHTVIMITAI